MTDAAECSDSFVPCKLIASRMSHIRHVAFSAEHHGLMPACRACARGGSHCRTATEACCQCKRCVALKQVYPGQVPPVSCYLGWASSAAPDVTSQVADCSAVLCCIPRRGSPGLLHPTVGPGPQLSLTDSRYLDIGWNVATPAVLQLMLQTPAASSREALLGPYILQVGPGPSCY